MARRAAIGIIGCGNISEAYLRLAPVFKNLKIVAVADIVPEVAKARAGQFSVRALSVDDLLKNDEIDAVVNLTVPDVHYQVTKAILSAGKHAYSEKPLALTSKDAAKLVAEADRRGLKLGGAPDTFLGAGGQTARKLIDGGTIGRVIGGTAYVMSHGMEHWHPNPGFFFQPGAGPVFDVGVYYITALVNLLGGVRSVTAMASRGFAARTVTSNGPMKGKKIKVNTPTNINAILDFANGAQVTLGASWDVWKHGHANPIEIYGSDGSMLVPDPNFFAGKVAWSDGGGEYTEIDTAEAPFGKANWPWSGQPTRANYRMLGVADLIDAAAKNREPRCSGRLAAHVVEVMEGILTSAEKRNFVKVRSTVDRPKPLTAADAKRLMA
ncbi:MAG: Gfo/Idh/MocA family oxidoreductase, partial [Bauldia sp.]|nr:Gfo/Idh/MocA family oxidoreductase [Bauldia sp.]